MRRGIGTKTQRRMPSDDRGGDWRDVHRQRDVKDCWPPAEPRKRQGKTLPCILQREHGPAVP